MGATLGVGVRQLASSSFRTDLNLAVGLGSVLNVGTGGRFEGFFSPLRERDLVAPFDPWSSGTRWADTIHATFHRDWWFETIALPREARFGTSDDDTDLGWNVKAASRSRDPLSTENLDRLFAESWESVEAELFRETTSFE